MSEEKKTTKPVTIGHALIVLGLTIVVMAVGIIVYGVDVHAPMFIGVIFAACMALFLGFKWEAIEKMMMDGIYKALQSIIILVIVGILVGVWLDTGVVPSMIYYGLKLLHPSVFLVAVVLICSITSLATGTSWGTMATMGVAMLGISVGLGISTPATIGAILSGAYFGDKMSPLSDTTNLAPAMAGTDVMTHVKFMLLPTGITYIITLIFFAVVGFMQYNGGHDVTQAQELMDALKGIFTINPLFLLPPIIVIVAVAMKVPAVPGITLGIISAAIIGMIFQPASTLGTILATGYGGYALDMENPDIIAAMNLVSDPGVREKVIEKLLTGGGIDAMMFSVSLTILAMMFGGIMEGTGMMGTVVDQIKKIARTPASLVVATEVTCVLSNATMPEQYISIVIPGRMYAKEYEKMGLHPACLSNALESAGTVTSALIPWNTCGAYITSTFKLDEMGITAAQYGPWAIFNWLMPIMNIILAYLGITVADMNNVRLAKKKKAKA